MTTKHIFMPRDRRDKWLAALRSGEHKQAEGCLRREHDGSMCCLGVLEFVADGTVEDLVFPSQQWLEADFTYREPPETADLELSPPIEIKTVTQLGGVEFSRFTDDAIFDIIRDLETTWDHLSKIRAKPKALKNRMNEINATVDQLVVLLDARTDAAATK